MHLLKNIRAVQNMNDDAKNCGLVFVKTYKTGSTSVAEFLSAIAYVKGLHCLHPSSGGNYREGELKMRAKRGEIYDMSFRHPTPRLDEDALENLIPNAKWVTIIREPIARFVSTMFFVKKIGMRYGFDPIRIAEAIRNKQIPPDDANAFCENFAHVLSGRRGTTALAYSDSPEIIAHDLILRLEKRNYLVLVQDDLLSSLAILALEMNWTPDVIQGIGISNARKSLVSGGRRGPKRQTTNNQVSCQSGSSCARAVLQCNAIDQHLYLHYKEVFARRLAAFPNLQLWIDAIQAATPGHAISSLPGPWARHYPINCQLHNPNAPPQRHTWRKLHSCQGRQTSLLSLT